jgi:ectoine hydroxylase-related dioxygenase (phytanoyl-CoA dioxygenase family)
MQEATASPKEWILDPAEAPWFDQPNAAELLEERRAEENLSDEEFALLENWLDNGYCVVKGVVDEATIDGMLAGMDNLWTAEEPFEGLFIPDVRLSEDAPPTQISHADLLALDLKTRMWARDHSNWRVLGFYQFSDSGREIFENQELIRLTSLVLGRETEPTFTLNFTYGSQQALHQDSAVFHIVPPNFLIGAWLACEDIDPRSGPLVFHPGTHREPMYPGFDNYPQTNFRTTPDQKAYTAWANEVAARYARKLFTPKKSEILLWNGKLIHGGSAVEQPGMTRKSYVCHYIPPGMDVSGEIVGPFNW